MATPFLLLVYDVHDAIQINIILSLLISILMSRKIWRDMDKDRFFSLLKGSIIGLPIGILVYVFLDVQYLKIAISIIILVLTFLLMLNMRINQTRGRDLFSGGISGLLTTSIGMPGPPLLLYFTGVGVEKAILRSTTLGFYVFIYSGSLAMQIFFDGTNKNIWTSSLLSIPIVLLGIFLGQHLFERINQKMFRIITYIILLFTGSYLFVTSTGITLKIMNITG
jgi:uncharacterized membrane protein YfcA